MIRTVALLVDASPTAGLGHLMRTSVLADALQARGCACRFELTDPFGLPHVAAYPTGVFDGGEIGADMLVVDGYGFDGAALDRLRRGVRRLVLIDDLADRPYPADVVVNHNLYGDRLDYSGYGAGLVLGGPRYAMVRDALFALRRHNRRRGTRALFCFGGGRTAAAGVHLAETVAKLGRFSIDVALGNAVPPPDMAAGLDIHYYAGADMPAMMSAATLYVGGLGVSFLEALAAGLEVIGVETAENQRLARAAAVDLGLSTFPAFDAAAIAEVVARNLRRPAAVPGPEILHEGGALRVADAILAG